MSVKTYDPANVAVTVSGVLLSGFPAGTFVSFEPNTDSFTLTTGCDGESCRSKTNNRSGRLSLTLLQSSESNQVLSALHNIDLVTPNGDGLFPVFIKNLISPLDTLLMEKSWVVRPPTKEYALDISNRVWLIETDFYIFNEAGSPSI